LGKFDGAEIFRPRAWRLRESAPVYNSLTPAGSPAYVLLLIFTLPFSHAVY